jgi:hypothetical protein
LPEGFSIMEEERKLTLLGSSKGSVSGVLPQDFCEKIGLSRDAESELRYRNDGQRQTFAVIADHIEKAL